MDVRDAVASRFSCRAFLPTPVPLATVREILERAARAPSGGNLQPWRVHALAGAVLEDLKARIRPYAPDNPRGEGAEYQVYPSPLKEPYYARRFEVGADLYRAIGIPREDRPARYRQYAPQFRVLRRAGRPPVHDRPQHGAAAMVGPRHVRPDRDAARPRLRARTPAASRPGPTGTRRSSAFLALPAEEMVFCGMALGHADPAAPINGWRSTREALDGFASFSRICRRTAAAVLTQYAANRRIDRAN